MKKTISSLILKATTLTVVAALVLSTAKVVYAWHGNVDAQKDCEGWSLNISASPSSQAHWTASPAQSGDWSGSDTIQWEVNFTWDNSSETDNKQGTLNKPEDCSEPTPTPTPEPSPTPTPEPTPTPTPGPTPTPTPSDNPGCPFSSPTAAPVLSGFRSSATSIVLTWNSVGPVTHYMVRYGTSSGNYQYGLTDIGNTTIYEVKDLQPNTVYYFEVAGANECAAGHWSNELSVGQVLAAATHVPVAAGTSNMNYLATAAALASSGVVLRFLSKYTKGLYIFGR